MVAFRHLACRVQPPHHIGAGGAFLRAAASLRPRTQRTGLMTAEARKPAAPMSNQPGRSRNAAIDEMIRVDHAGEYGAVRIYEGQLAVLRHLPGREDLVAKLEHMAKDEEIHLARFNELVNEREVRPTAFAPVWHVAGFALGAATALLGEKAAHACTAAVEEVIDG